MSCNANNGNISGPWGQILVAKIGPPGPVLAPDQIFRDILFTYCQLPLYCCYYSCLKLSHWCQKWDFIPVSLTAAIHQVVRVSARPPSKFSATTDFALWFQRFEIYLCEAEIPPEKRAREPLSFLDDGPFRIVHSSDLWTVMTVYSCVKEQLQKHYAQKGDDLEWCYIT